MPIPRTPFPVGRGSRCKERGRSPLSKSLPPRLSGEGEGGEVGYITDIDFHSSNRAFTIRKRFKDQYV